MNIHQIKSAHALRESALARLAEAAACRAAGVGIGDLRSRRREPEAGASARRTGMYLAHVAFALSLSSVGRGFGRDRSTVRQACALIEDGRDDAALDHGLAALEQALAAFAVAFRLQQPEHRP